jgi:ribosomal-protein-alanine N-acetyltransferase
MKLQSNYYWLRIFEENDLKKIFDGLSNPDVIRYYGISYASIEETKNQLNWFMEIEKNNTGRWRAIISKQNNEFLGAIGFNYWSIEHRRADLGFWLLPQYWGMGIIKEVLPVMISFGFKEMKLHRIEAEIESKNISPRKLLLKQGFIHEGTKRDYEVKNNQFIDLDIYSLLENDSMSLND